MKTNDKFQRDRAYESRAWFDSYEYKTHLILDKALRAERDRALGHTHECTLTKCSTQCSMNRKKSSL